METDGEEKPRVERGPEAGPLDEVADVDEGVDKRRMYVEGESLRRSMTRRTCCLGCETEECRRRRGVVAEVL